MALTNLEQLQIISGQVAPDSTSLDALVHQAAFNFATTFYMTYNATAFDGQLIDGEFVYNNPQAAAYANKMLNISSQVFRASGTDIQRLTRIMVVLIGNTAATLPQVQNATDAQWDSFVGAQIDECFELFAGVRQDEKAAYNALP
jgi:hypothetical protein